MHLLYGLLSALGRSDPQRALSLLQQVQSLANQVIGDDPEGALAWVATLSNEQKRMDSLQQLARQWSRYDRENARRWVEGHGGFSAETKEQLLKQK